MDWDSIYYPRIIHELQVSRRAEQRVIKDSFDAYETVLSVPPLAWGHGSIMGIECSLNDSTILAEGVSLSLGLAGVAGVGLALAVVYELATTDPDEFSVGRVTFGVVVVAAVFTLIGAGLQLVA